MATTADKGKGLECPKFMGKDEEYQVWITKFETYAKVKGFYTRYRHRRVKQRRQLPS